MYHGISPIYYMNNINNTISSVYSKNKVRNLLQSYIEKNNITYDFVIICRFDHKNKINIQLSTLDSSCVYVSSCLYPRIIVPDNFIISPTAIFLDWFNLIHNFNIVMNSSEVDSIFNLHNEKMILNPEQIYLAHYLFHTKTLNKIKYVSFIPDSVEYK